MANTQRSSAAAGSIDTAEIERFDRLAAQWWDPTGPMRPLHEMNPLRVAWIDARLPKAARLPKGARLLDLGCGAGLASEALAGLGHHVLGLDAAAAPIAAAQAHAAGLNLPLHYRAGSAEHLVAEGERFTAITALEVIEHVHDPAAFMQLLASLLQPEGLLFVSTLNRTARSMVVAKLGAEYLMRLLPVGTHTWARFVTPPELETAGRAAGLRLRATAGMSFDLVTRQWRLTRDLSVNYIAMLSR